MMWTDPLLWLQFAGCVGAVICAAHLPHDGRWEAVSLACLLLANFGFYILAYTDYSPSWNLGKIGLEVSSVHLWMLADAISGCAAVAVAHRFWWGWALWAIGVVQIGFHAGMDAELFDPAFYTDKLLNFALLVQLVIFFVMGGRGVTDHLHRSFVALCLPRRVSAASKASARRQAHEAR